MKIDQETAEALIVFLNQSLNAVQEYMATSKAVNQKWMPLYYDGRRLVERSRKMVEME